MKKAVMIVAHHDFRDEELFQPQEILQNSGIQVTVASTALSEAQGSRGGRIIPNVLLAQVRADDFDAIIFVGGSGASAYWSDPSAHALAKEAVSQNKVLAAICSAPVTLAQAGVLSGRRATVWADEAKQLSLGGAKYTAKPVERDGLIITANGPAAAKDFAKEIVLALQ
jgi:protease I